MAIDVTRQIGAEVRDLSTREDGARVIVATRSYTTSVEDLWDALTNPQRLPRWFAPVSGELRLGGKYQVQGNASGEVVECDPPRRFGLTWEMQGNVSWVNVQLSEEAAGNTQLRLEHIAHVPGDFWNQYGPGAVGVGWDQALFGLDQHFSTGAIVRPEDAMAWIASEEGRSFVRQSSDAWCAASIAAGTEPSAAREAAERTRQFYTGDTSGQS